MTLNLDANENCCPAIPPFLDFAGPTPSATKVNLEEGQFGEAYHVLICRLILKHSPCTRVGITFTNNAGQFPRLFEWYNLQKRPGTTFNLNAASKANATQVIVAAFRAFNSHATVACHQGELFAAIRKHLDSRVIPVERGTDVAYPTPSDLARDWLNRYFCITNSHLSQHANALPKPSDVNRLAIIHIRETPLTPIGFIMDLKNLEHVASSIQSANIACTAAGSHCVPFTHVILYGDFTWDQGKGKADVVRQILGSDVEILFISRPWERDVDGGVEDINRLWDDFRDSGSGDAPVQVKILGIWTALCELYQPNACVIGFRSGFVECAGFIGIPVFLLNNERSKNAQALNSRFASRVGERLWKKAEEPKADRLREVSDVLNTFIPVEALKFVPTKQKEIARVEEGYEDELMGALFTFMCCEVDAKGMKETSCGWGALSSVLDSWLPGWTARVAMMHDTYEKHWGYELERGSEQCNDKSDYEAVNWESHRYGKQENSGCVEDTNLLRKPKARKKGQKSDVKPNARKKGQKSDSKPNARQKDQKSDLLDGMGYIIGHGAEIRKTNQDSALIITPKFTQSGLSSLSISLTVKNISVKSGKSIYWLVNNRICRLAIAEAHDDYGNLCPPVSSNGRYDQYEWYAERDTSGPIATTLEVQPYEKEAPGSDWGDRKWEPAGFKLFGSQILPELHYKLKSLGLHSATIEWNLSEAPKGTRATWKMSLDDDPEGTTYAWLAGSSDASKSIEITRFTGTLLDATYECWIKDLKE